MLPNTNSTKEKIIHLIKQHSQLSVVELSRELNITEMAIRRHIQLLESDGFVQTAVRKNTSGRPAKVYQLTENGEKLFPSQYKQIGLDLLQEIQRIDPTIIETAIIKRQERLASRFRNRMDGKSFQNQIEELAKIQTEMGFMAQGIEDENKELGQLKQSNCPYLDIARDFPKICQVEHQLFEELLNTKNIKKISSMSKGDSCCHYVISKD